MTESATAVGSVGKSPGLQQRVKRIGLIAGPLLALLLYFTLPHEYRAADGTSVVFGHAGRATLAAMGWMATWWMTEAVEIEVTSCCRSPSSRSQASCRWARRPRTTART